jgi:hypothetical protein
MWRTVSFLTAQASLTFRGPRLASAVVIENMLFTSTTLIRSSGSAAFKNLNDGQ